MINFDSSNISLAKKLDQKDNLSSFRNEFEIDDPNVIYLDGNSLGRLPKKTKILLKNVIDNEWGKNLVSSWNEWIKVSSKVGNKIAKICGAKEGEIIVSDSTSINLFKLAYAAVQFNSNKNKITSDVLNFPSDLYILHSVINSFKNKHTLELIPSLNKITISKENYKNIIDENTSLVSLSHVSFKSSFKYDVKEVTEFAHKKGALVSWDLSHSIGAVPIELNKWNVDLAVGCTYKYLNGGPGSPAFLYVKKDLQKKLQSPIWGWLGSDKPFNFELNFKPSSDISKFVVGTPPIISLKAIEPGVDLILQAGIENLRKKSITQTEYLIFLIKRILIPLGFSLGSPENFKERGSHVSIVHSEAFRITQALIDPKSEIRIISDFREPDNIRLGIAPIYNSFKEIYLAVNKIKEIVEKKIYENYSNEKALVT